VVVAAAAVAAAAIVAIVGELSPGCATRAFSRVALAPPSSWLIGV